MTEKETLLWDERGRGFPALVRYGPHLFLSGSDGCRDPETEELDFSLVYKPIEQCHNAFGRIRRRLERAGLTGDCVMRVLHFTSGQEWSLRRMAVWPDHFGEVGHSEAVAWGAQAKMADFNAITAMATGLTRDVPREIVVPQPRRGQSARLVRAGDFLYAFGVGGYTNPFTGEEVPINAPDAFRRQHFNNFETLRSFMDEVPAPLEDFVRLDAGFRRNVEDARAFRACTKDLFGGRIPFAHFALPLGELANRLIQLGGVAVAPGVEKEVHWSPGDPDVAETVRAGGLVFVSSLPGNLDPESGAAMGDLCADKRAQARQSLRCLSAALARAGTTMDRTLSLEVYLRDIYFEDEFIEVAKDVFGSDCPAIGVAGAELEEGIEVQLVGVAGSS